MPRATQSAKAEPTTTEEIAPKVEEVKEIKKPSLDELLNQRVEAIRSNDFERIQKINNDLYELGRKKLNGN